MRPDLTDITLVVDRSGSMEAIREDAQGGVNAFVREQAQEPGDALLTLVQFDTEYEFVQNGTPINEVAEYKLTPRGNTALLDAVGRAINETKERIENLDKDSRPGLVLFIIVTDGLENSSKEFTKSQVKTMIERQQGECDWHFTYLGANQDAFHEAGGMGMYAAGSAGYAMRKSGAAYKAVSGKTGRMRKQRRSGEEVVNEFTDEEREQME